jgi:endoglucanase
MRGGAAKEEETAAPIEECFIDLGLPAEEVARLVRIGDPVTFTGRCWENETAFTGKALDDRVGIFIMLEAAARAGKIDCDLFLIASVQEEYGLRGAGPAVFSVKPDIFIALEGTVASDTPALRIPSNLTPTRVGKGPEIRLTDSRMISDRSLADFLDRIAEEKMIPRQTVVKKMGSTDAAAGQVAGPGVRTCAVSVPVRYIHAPAALLYKSDVENAVSLIAAFLERASGFKPVSS